MTILMWIGIVVGGIVVLLLLPLIWMAVTGASEPPKGITLDVKSPRVTHVGQPFDLVVTVRNEFDRERMFHSLDLDNSLLKGFTIDKVEPEPEECSAALGTTAHHFRVPIAPTASIVFTLRCRGKTPGEHAGNVMVFVDKAHASFLPQPVQIVVK